MSRSFRSGVIATLTAAVIAAPALAGNVTVGRFYVELAQAKGMTSANPYAAELGLRSAGVDLPALDLNKALTEGDVASIAGALGLNVTTTRPGQPITEAKLGTFMEGFGPQIAAPSVKGGSVQTPFQTLGLPPQASNGKGKKKGHNKSTSEPF
jgi:hypothetical protein